MAADVDGTVPGTFVAVTLTRNRLLTFADWTTQVFAFAPEIDGSSASRRVSSESSTFRPDEDGRMVDRR